MPRIKRSPPKRLAPMAADVKEYIEGLTDCPEAEIPERVRRVGNWPFAKTDFFHWVPVLNRFDTILETLNAEYQLSALQTKDFSAEHKALLLAVLSLTTQLWKNCTNRSLYNSYEHLTELLYTGDLDVLTATVQLVLRPAQRLGSQRSLRNTLGVAQERVTILAQHWGIKQLGLELDQLVADDLKIPPECNALHFQFYRKATDKPPAEAVNIPATAETTAGASASATPTRGLKLQKIGSEAASDKQSTGLTVVHINDIHSMGKSDQKILVDLVEQYQVPAEHKFPLMQKIRVALNIRDAASRRKLLTIRILSIAVLGKSEWSLVGYLGYFEIVNKKGLCLVILGTEELIQSRLFTFEPDLVQRLADILHMESNEGDVFELQAACLHALDSMAHHRSRLGEVLTAVNASANHGILMFILRKAISAMDSDEQKYPLEFVDALFGFVAYIASTQSGGTMIITAGVLPILIELMRNQRPDQLKAVTRCVLLLDSLVFGFTSSFAPFTAANGLDILVNRIQDEVAFCFSFKAENVTSADLPHERISLLRSLLKFVLHMMQTSGSADRMRNLIDTSLPTGILTIFNESMLFGASIFGLAVNIMSTFIHNEPTCLSILQEAHLPQALLAALAKEIPISAEVISALPNAFGAICLNAQGLEQFNEAKPVGKYLELLTSEEHIKTLQDNDVPHLVGNSMDELMRHHPSLKDYVMTSIIDMLKRVVAFGEQVPSDDPESAGLQIMKATPKPTEDDEEKKESRTSQFIDLIARFLEGLFQNVAHCKDFIKMDGVQIMLKCYTLPTLPYDFATSASSYSLSYLFRLMIEANAPQVVGYMLTEIHSALEAAEHFLSFKGPGSLVANYIDLKDEDTERIAEGQRVFRSLITLQGFIRLLSDIYCTHVLSHTKSVLALIQTFSGDIGSTFIARFGAIYRTCVWENLLLKDTVPKQWYETASKKTDKGQLTRGSMASALLDVDVLDSVLEATPTAASTDTAATPVATGSAAADTCSDKDPRILNTRAFRHLLSQIPTVMTPTLQGILKLLTTRRISEVGNRKAGQMIVDDIAAVLRDHFTWERPSQDPSSNKYSYLAVVLGFVSVMFVEERGLHLHMNLAAAFHKTDGTQCIVNAIQKLWDEADALSAEPDKKEDPALTEKRIRISGALELALNVLQTLSNAKLVHDSPLTGPMMSRERDKTSPEYFDPHEYITDVRTRVGPLVLQLWKSDYLKRAPANIVRSILAIVTHITKGEGEVKGEGPPSLAPINVASLFSRHAAPPVVAEEEKIQQLVDMGFPRAAAETALVRCANHVGRAAEYLLMHPNLVATAGYAGASASASSAAPAPAAAATDPAPATVETEPPASPAAPAPESAPAATTNDPMDTSDSEAGDEDPDLAAALALSMGPEEAQPAAERPADETPASSQEPTPMDLDVAEESPADKGKGPAPVESALEKLRNELKADIPSRSLELLDNVDEKVIFSIKELFCLVGVSDIPATIKYVGDDIERAREEMVQNPSQANTKRFAVRLRLFTLIVSDAAWQKSGIENSQPLIGCLLQMTSADGISSSSWLPSALLVLESYISLSDEPKSVPFQLPDGTTTNYDHNVDNGVLKRLTTEERLKFMQSLVSLMALDTIDKEMLHAVMRLIVRLTRSHGIAIEFARVGGIPLLFNPNRIGLFHAQPAMTIMILRHIIEDSAILKATMERELVHWFTHPRPRTADIPGFIKAHSHLICRDVDAFLAAATEVCVLPRYEKSILRPTQIAMQQKDAAPDVSEPAPEVTPMDVDPAREKEPVAPAVSAAVEQLKSNYMSDLSEMVVQFLVSELMALKRSSVVSSANDLSVTRAPQDSSTAGTSASTTTAGEPSEPDREKLLHLQRCFLLQCLGELVVSYATCKLDVINVSQKRAFKGTPHKGTFGRNPFLNHLVQDLLPQSLITGVAPGDETPERQRAIWDSKWTTCVISALCLGVTSDVAQERAMYPELANVRRCVLDVLARSLRETINHTDIATDLRHSRLMTISELCFRILTARGPGALGTPGPPGSEDIATHLGRTMLEKGFVNLLTQSLAEIDIHHPCSSQLIAAILKPLEFLTKLAIKLGKTGEPKSAQAKSDAASAVVLPNGVVPMEETSAELADMFRNSALGMYNAPTSDEDMDDDSSEDSEDEDGYDEFSDDEDISDPDEMDEDEGSDDEEMELVVPQPYQGNPDPSDDDEEDDEDGEMGSITGGEFVHDDDDDDEDDDPDDDDSETRMSWTAGYHDVGDHPADLDEAGLMNAHPMDLAAEEFMADAAHDDEPVNPDDEEVRENDHDSEEDDDNQDLLDDEEEDSEDEDGEGSHDIFEEEDFVDDPDNPFLDGHVGGRGNFFVDGRRRARRSARRQIMEVELPTGGGLDIQWVPDDDRGSMYPEAGEFQVLGRPLGGRPPHAPVDDGMAHPLLVNQAANGSRPNVRGDITAHRGRGGSSGVRAGDVLDWQAFDDLIGGNALQILEQLFYRGDRVAPPQLQHMDVGLSDMGHGMAPGGLVAGIPIGGSRRAPPAASAGEGSSAQRPADAPEPSLIDQQLAFIHAFTPQGTSDRWGQEARLMYGTSAPEKGARATNALVNALMPAAIEAAEKRKELEEKAEKQRQESEKIRREEERKRLEEEAQKQKEEEERLRKEAEEAAAAAAAAATAAAAANPTPEVPGTEGASDAMDVEPAAEGQQSTEAAAPPAEERVVVTVNGREYDITGSGIDVDFLQALPDDLQQDVIDQHFRDQRRTQQVTEVPTDISSEFLDALPEEIRNEVMAQQRREQERRNRAATSAPSASARPMEIDPASFFATLDPALRQTVLMEQEDGFLATLPSALVAEANAFRGQRNRGRLGRMFQTRPPSAAAAAILASLEGIPSKKPAHREAVHLLDRPALLTLIRMLFLPEPVSIALLHRTLVNLCENSKTRVELVSLFLSILADGSTDLAAVDKSFSQLSLKAKGKHAAATPKKGGAAALATPGAPALAHAENVPNLVAQRCLDALSQMIVFNESVARLFLLDTESMGPNFAKTPKKGKGKEKAVEYKYPIVALLSLLHRPAFLNSAPLMERLMHIISMILRLLTFVNGKAKEAKEKAEKAEAKPTASDEGAEPAGPSASSAVPPATPGASSSTAEPPATPATPKKPTNTLADWKPPVIPDQYVSAVVHVLTAGVCTGKSFQYTLTVVQHLFGNPSNRDTITRELADAAQRLGDALVPDLDELTHVLQTASTAVEVQSATLGKFTQSSSQQSKLLRVLKTIDFIHTKGKISEKNTTGSLSSVLGLGTDPLYSDTSTPAGNAIPLSAIDDTLSKATDALKEDGETRLLAIYDRLQLPKLWQRLGACLTLINDKEALIHVATVLLPAIESFMVVSKPYVVRKKAPVTTAGSQPPSLSRSSTGQHTGLIDLNNEDLFVVFTEEHRKILNTMVRNSPSLMSGSFSLLVHNQKVLEFDNKRTYFNLQLHKRTTRDHYGTLQINVRRQYVFEDSYHQLQGRSGDEIKFSKLNVRFYEEEGVDAGGVTREWFSVLARQMFNPDYALFRPSAVDKVTYQPNRLSGINPDHLLYFKFVGRVIGKAIYDGRLLDAYFTRSFYKSLIDAPVDYKDMEAVDPEFHKSLEWILQNDITDVLDLTFSTEIDEFGKKQIIDLKPDGRNLPVTDQNKMEYVKLVVDHRLITAIRVQIEAFLSGFHDVIPRDLVKIFNEQELELLISGMPDIDIDDWKNNTEYQNYTQSSPQVQWFWRAVRSFSQEERAKLVQFATGTSKVPLEGFAELQGSGGVQKFQIHKDFSSPERLPSAHTCFNQLDLPLYESYEQLRSSLLIAISEGATGFGFV
ncbi:hypothetical protein HDU90_000079 [Geranomyces variabilis]|nr:hypothetical protein HDU90_000079 [Geranomyces variabilis]